MNYNVLIAIFYFKKWLTILDGELRQHRACTKNIAVPQDAVAEDLGENPPGLKPSI